MVDVFEFDADISLTPEQIQELEDRVDREVAERYGESYLATDYQFLTVVKVFVKRGVRRLPRKGGK